MQGKRTMVISIGNTTSPKTKQWLDIKIQIKLADAIAFFSQTLISFRTINMLIPQWNYWAKCSGAPNGCKMGNWSSCMDEKTLSTVYTEHVIVGCWVFPPVTAHKCTLCTIRIITAISPHPTLSCWSYLADVTELHWDVLKISKLTWWPEIGLSLSV